MVDITILPFDLKGTLGTNRFVGEEHTLTKVPNKTNRMFAPKFGAFYKDSLEVRTIDGVRLNYDTDYVCTYYYDELWDLNAKACCAIIVVVNPTISANIRITYQAVGGPYALSLDELKDVLDEVANSPETIGWDDIRNKPLQFPPAPHTHEYWQLYGLETTVTNLELLGEAWAVGRKGILADNRYYYENFIDLAQQALDTYTAHVMAHITDYTNPHLTDKFKVGLGLINNWGIANETDAGSITVNNQYQSIGGVYDQLEATIIPIFDSHLRNMDNPHQVRLDDPLLNLYSAQQIQQLFDDKLKRTDPAYSTAAFNGISISQFYDNLRVNLNTSCLLENSVMPQDRMAPPINGWNAEEHVLLGNQTYTPYESLFKSYNDTQGAVYFIGAQALTAYEYLSTGTYVIRGVYTRYFAVNMMRLTLYIKTASGWTLLA